MGFNYVQCDRGLYIYHRDNVRILMPILGPSFLPWGGHVMLLSLSKALGALLYWRTNIHA